MAFFSQEWLQELLSKINIEDVVGEYVTLQNKSGRLWACCPFHNEKTPSFSVNAERGFYHCFGCGKGGNAIQFVMEQEKMTFVEACTYLAEKVNLEIPTNVDNKQYEKNKAMRERIFAMNKIVAGAYHKALFSEDGKEALQYLKKRGFLDNTIRAFGLGYAKDSFDSILQLLLKEGYTKQEMSVAGLVRIKEDKCYDLFRNRVMIPIINTFSQVVGFGGRVMDDSLPKYLNSPETPTFRKSKNLYNLNIVRKQKNIQYILLAEGYMDVIALVANGLPTTVATLGTAITKDQARLIAKYSKIVYISYDGDGAGKKAALRAIDILEKEQLDCRIISIPEGKDPDDYMSEKGRDGYLELLKNAKSSVEYKFDIMGEKYDLADPFQKENYAKECIAILKSLNGAILKEKYAGVLAERTGFSQTSILQDVGDIKPETKTFKKEPEKRVVLTAEAKAENYIAGYICINPEVIRDISNRLSDKDFTLNANKKIFLYILKSINKGISPTGAEILSIFENDEEKNHVSKLLVASADVFGEGKKADAFLADCIKHVLIRTKTNALQECFAEYKESEDAQHKAEVSKRIKLLTGELSKLKGSV